MRRVTVNNGVAVSPEARAQLRETGCFCQPGFVLWLVVVLYYFLSCLISIEGLFVEWLTFGRTKPQAGRCRWCVTSVTGGWTFITYQRFLLLVILLWVIFMKHIFYNRPKQEAMHANAKIGLHKSYLWPTHMVMLSITNKLLFFAIHSKQIRKMMLRNPRGIVNVVFTRLCLEKARTHTFISLSLWMCGLSPLRASVHAVQIAVIGDVFVFRLGSWIIIAQAFLAVAFSQEQFPVHSMKRKQHNFTP